jgi:hypothetical protein
MNRGSPVTQPAGPLPDARAVLAGLWGGAGLPPSALDRVTFTGREPALPTSFAVGTALQAAVGAAALAAAGIGRLRGGPEQTVSVDMADVVRESACRFTIDGHAPSIWDKLSGLYRCGGDPPGWIRVHANFAHHRDGVLELLGLPPGPGTERVDVSQALLEWSAEDFEAAAAATGLFCAAVQTLEE